MAKVCVRVRVRERVDFVVFYWILGGWVDASRLEGTRYNNNSNFSLWLKAFGAPCPGLPQNPCHVSKCLWLSTSSSFNFCFKRKKFPFDFKNFVKKKKGFRLWYFPRNFKKIFPIHKVINFQSCIKCVSAWVSE